MKIKVFIDWVEHEVLSEEGMRKRIQEISDSFFLNSDFFNDWLNENYLSVELFTASNEEKEEIYSRFREYCSKQAAEEFEVSFETVIVE